MGYRLLSMLTLLAVASAGVASGDAGDPQPWRSLLSEVDLSRDVVAGDWTRTEAGLRVAASSGARLALPAPGHRAYDFRVAFTRHTGRHSLAMMVVHGTGQATFEVDAWGEHLAGLQNIAGKTMQDNATRQADMRLENGRRYVMTVEVRPDGVRALLDDRVVAEYRGDGGDLSLLGAWSVPAGRLGVGAWESETTIHAIDFRPLEAVSPPQAVTPATRPVTQPAVQPASAPVAAQVAPVTPAGKPRHVLIVIANHHFFYREYAEPRAELERAGMRVTVAAGRKAPCRPHQGSGEGGDGGVVQPDLALSQVKAADYDAILFSGGWGSSAYQFAFTGRYNDPAYNGEREVKAVVNRLIGEFLAQDKYVAALCNAVSVLAWARIDGRSPLQGRRVCAPVREAAAGIYEGRQAQPSCRWHPEVNGAIMSPAGAIGRRDTAADDVLVDGRIVTGEDDISSREMGRRLVQLLSQR